MEIARLMSHTSTTTTVLTATSFMVACAHLKVRASLVRLPTPLSMPPTSAEGTSSTFANLTMLAMRGWENLKENEYLFSPKTESVNIYGLLGWFKKTIVFIFYMMFYMTFYMMFFMMSSCSSRFSVTKWKITYVTCLRQSQWKKLQFSWTCFFLDTASGEEVKRSHPAWENTVWIKIMIYLVINVTSTAWLGPWRQDLEPSYVCKFALRWNFQFLTI